MSSNTLIWQITQLVLQYLLTQPPQLLSQLHIFGLFRRVGDLAIGYDLHNQGQSVTGYSHGKDTHILPLNIFLNNVFTGRSEECRSTSLVVWVFEEGSNGCDAYLALGAKCLDSLLWLICVHSSWMYGKNPWACLLWTLEPWLIVFHPSNHGSYSKNLSELGAVVQKGRADVGIDFIQAGEGSA